MDIKLFGKTIRLEIILLCIILGYLIFGHTLCSCSKISLKEGFQMFSGSPLDWKMGSDVPGSLENSRNQLTPVDNIYQGLEGNSATNPNDAVNSGMMDIFGDTTFSPTCCKYSAYSNSLGCACETVEQAEFLNSRGGNKTFAGI